GPSRRVPAREVQPGLACTGSSGRRPSPLVGPTEGVGRVAGGRNTSTMSSTHLSASSAEARRLQVRLWEQVLVARYLAILVLAGAALLAADELGTDRFWLSGALLVLALPYNLALHLHLRRTGSLPPLAAVADQVAASLAVVLI